MTFIWGDEMLEAARLSLHHLTALDASPLELIGIAGRVGCAHVTLFTDVPEQARHIYPKVESADIAAIREALARANVSVCNLEIFPLDRDGEVNRFADGLQVGAAIGATRATVHLHDIVDEAQAMERFAIFAAAAAEHGIVAGLEFNGFSAVRDIESAARIVRGAQCGSLVLDVLHLMRNGADVTAVARHADLITYAQFCDGPLNIDVSLAWHEAVRERAVPGQRAFPLAAILASLDQAVIIEAEVPQTAERKAGVSPELRARRAVAGIRAL